jgi:AraC-like DNA-binding protein
MYFQSLIPLDAGSSSPKATRVGILGKAEVIVALGGLPQAAEHSADACDGTYLLVLRTKAAAERGGDQATLLQSGQCTIVEGSPGVAVESMVNTGCLAVQFTQAALDAISDDANATRVTSLGSTGEPLRDECVTAIGAAMVSDIDAATPSSRLFLSSLALALLTHVAIRYGGLGPLERIRKGGLAPWQVQRAQERMLAGLDTDVELSAVARECGLSMSHFSRAFRNTVGEPPHTWLVKRRLEAAKEMMASRDVTLATVALSCGFADQSHFTRAFTRQVGTSPGLWRRCLAR